MPKSDSCTACATAARASQWQRAQEKDEPPSLSARGDCVVDRHSGGPAGARPSATCVPWEQQARGHALRGARLTLTPVATTRASDHVTWPPDASVRLLPLRSTCTTCGEQGSGKREREPATNGCGWELRATHRLRLHVQRCSCAHLGAREERDAALGVPLGALALAAAAHRRVEARQARASCAPFRSISKEELAPLAALNTRRVSRATATAATQVRRQALWSRLLAAHRSGSPWTAQGARTTRLRARAEGQAALAWGAAPLEERAAGGARGARASRHSRLQPSASYQMCSCNSAARPLVINP